MYLVPFTVPNVCGDDLRGTIENLNKCFSKFWRYISYDVGHSSSFKGRYMFFEACLKLA